jgi:hypothetical protein
MTRPTTGDAAADEPIMGARASPVSMVSDVSEGV